MTLPKSLTTVTPFSKFIALALFLLLPIVGFYFGARYENPKKYPPLFLNKNEGNAVLKNGHCAPGQACTGSSPSQRPCTLEAKICPDGTSVGRTGPNCEFAPCPLPTFSHEQVNPLPPGE